MGPIVVRALLPALRQGPRRGPPLGRDLMLVPAAGGAPQVLRHFAGDPLPGHPAWSPDGKQLVLPLSTATQPSSSRDARCPERARHRDRQPAGDHPAVPGRKRSTGHPTARGSCSARRAGTASSPTSCARRDRPAQARPQGTQPQHAQRRTRASWTRGRCGRAGPPTVARSCSSATRAPAAAGASAGAQRGPDRLAVFVMNPDGSGAHRLTHGARAESSPSWAPAR